MRTFLIEVPAGADFHTLRRMTQPDGVERFEVSLMTDASWKDENGHQLACIRGTGVGLTIADATVVAYSRMRSAAEDEERRRREVREQRKESPNVDLGEIDLSSLGL